jgi:hypothetical protein
MSTLSPDSITRLFTNDATGGSPLGSAPPTGDAGPIDDIAETFGP